MFRRPIIWIKRIEYCGRQSLATDEEAIWVGKLSRIIAHIVIEMVLTFEYPYSIGFDIPSYCRVVIAIVVVVQPRLRIKVLPWEFQIIRDCGYRDRRFPEGFVVRGPYNRA